MSQQEKKDKSQQNMEADNSPSKKMAFKEFSYFYRVKELKGLLL